MPLTEIDKKAIDKIVGEYCRNRVPSHLRQKIKLIYTIRGNDVKITETRPHWQIEDKWTEMPIARFKRDEKSMKWQLYWVRSNGRWEKYPELKPTKDLKKIVNEIECDPLHAFWG